MHKEELKGVKSNELLLYLFALGAHCLMLLIFLSYKITIMVYINMVSILLYTFLSWITWKYASRRVQTISVVLSTTEVIFHQIAAIVCVGSEMGFQYFLIMIGLILMLQSKDIIRKQTKIIFCSAIILILISIQLYASAHTPIYELPLSVKQIMQAVITLVSILGVFVFAYSQWEISEHYRGQIELLLGERNSKIQEMQAKTIQNFADLVESRDGNTGGHIKRTSAYVDAIINALTESGIYTDILTKEYAQMVISAAPLHDIGKIAISDSILLKKGKLTDEEYEVMKTHSATGGNMLDELLGDMESEEYVQIAIDVARSHHEKWNGRGYPDQIKGDEIPLCARIMSVADVFDALTSVRSYKDRFSMDRAYEIMESEAGQQFDAAIIREFVRIRPRIEAICESLSEE